MAQARDIALMACVIIGVLCENSSSSTSLGRLGIVRDLFLEGGNYR